MKAGHDIGNFFFAKPIGANLANPQPTPKHRMIALPNDAKPISHGLFARK